jgi:small subunit ribosomal protein S2
MTPEEGVCMSHYDVDAQELLDAGCHFGHQAKRWNPKMKPFIYTERDGVHIFDLVKTGALLEEAMEFVRDTVRSGKEVVFLGAKRQAKSIVLEEAMKAGAPYVTERWLGGMLTNWDEMEKRIKKLNTLKKQRDNNELTGYTKKERVMIDKKIERLSRFFGGIAHLKTRPDAIFVVDTHREKTSVFEAGVVGAKVVGMVDTNADPTGVDFPIPVNDDAVRSIKLVVAKIAQAYAEGKAMRAKEQPVVVVAKQEVAINKPTVFAAAPAAGHAVVAPVRAKEVNPAFTKVAEAIKPKKVLKPTATTKKASTKKKVVVSLKKRK